jgi:hypothetical protein
MAEKLYHGSCHCGAVRFTARIDLTQGIRKCNCTFCVKTKFWKAFAYGDALQVTAGADALEDYRGPHSSWPEGAIHHLHCRTCGVRGFSKGNLPMAPFNGWFHAVNVNCLDDVTPEEIIAAPVIFEDGLADKQMETPAETRHL